MEASRLNIMKEKPPALVFKNKAASFAQDVHVGKVGQVEVMLEVVGKSLSMDDNGNEIMKYTLAVVSANPIDSMKARHDTADRKRI